MQLEQLAAQLMEDPRAQAFIDQLADEFVEEGVSYELLDTMIEALGGVVDDPSTYPEVRAYAIQNGLADESELPEEFDPVLIVSVLLALVETRDRMANNPRAFAKGGLVQMAQKVQEAGRDGDKILAHISPREAEVLRLMGGSGTVNPNTGLVEFKKKKGILGKIVAVAAMVFAPVLAPMIGAAVGLGTGIAGSAFGGALLGAGTSAISGGNVLKGALLGGLGSGLGSAFGGAASGVEGSGLSAAGSGLQSASSGLANAAGASTMAGAGMGSLSGALGQGIGSSIGTGLGQGIGAGISSSLGSLGSSLGSGLASSLGSLGSGISSGIGSGGLSTDSLSMGSGLRGGMSSSVGQPSLTSGIDYSPGAYANAPTDLPPMDTSTLNLPSGADEGMRGIAAREVEAAVGGMPRSYLEAAKTAKDMYGLANTGMSIYKALNPPDPMEFSQQTMQQQMQQGAQPLYTPPSPQGLDGMQGMGMSTARPFGLSGINRNPGQMARFCEGGLARIYRR